MIKILRHVVLFKFKDDTKKGEIDLLIYLFTDLKVKLKEIIDMEWGLNVSPEEHHQGFTHCFTISFRSLEDLAAYQVNFHHIAFQKILQPVLDKVFVVDYWTEV